MSNRWQLAASLTLALLLAIGATAIWGILYAFGAETWSRTLRTPYTYESFSFLANGEPAVRFYDDPSGNPRFRTLDGQTIANTGIIPTASFGNLAWTYNNVDPRRWITRIQAMSPGEEPRNPWYFIADGRQPGHGYLVGYAAVTRLPIGYFGRSGFQPTPPAPADWFPVDCMQIDRGRHLSSLNGIQSDGFENYVWNDHYATPTDLSASTVFLITDGRLLAIDVANRQMEEIELPERPLQMSIFERVRKNLGDSQVRQLAVQTAAGMSIVDNENRVVQTWALPELPETQFQFFLTGNNEAVYSWQADSSDDGNLHRIIWTDTAGAVTRQAEMRTFNWRGISPRAMSFNLSTACPAPLQIILFPFLYAYHNQGWPLRPYGERLQEALSFAWPAALIYLPLAAVLSWWTWRRQQRLAQPHAATWAAFVALFGPAGLIGYLAFRARPPLWTCASCQATVPHDRTSCARCAAEFPEPAPLGIEVFA